jgi:hypothetical protein
MVNCIQGYDLPELLNKKVILELDGLSGSDQAFVIGSFSALGLSLSHASA